jgi:uncharacterized protein DUF4440
MPERTCRRHTLATPVAVAAVATAVAFAAIVAAGVSAETPPPPAPPGPGAAPAGPVPGTPPAPHEGGSQAPPAGGEAPPAASAAAIPANEHGATPGDALAFFMSSRDYRTIRDLKSVMTASLKATYDKDPVPFNGHKGIRISAFDYREPSVGPAATGATVSVKSLWDDQGEAVEQRTESVRLARGADGLWSVGALARGASEPMRFKDSIAGVTSLRQILRAWVRRDFDAAKGLMSDAFLKRQAGREEGIEAVFAGDANKRRAAFRIVDMTPQGTASVTARVSLVETTPGRPSGLEGTPKTLVMVKKGQRWLLDDWR